MVKQKKAETTPIETEAQPASASQATPVAEKASSGLKKSTIITGILLLGAAAVWGIVGYQAMRSENGQTLFGKYFHSNDDVVVATIDGENVYLSQIKEIADRIPQYAELPFDMIYPHLLDKYITNQVVLKSAQEAEIQNDPAVREAIKETRNAILSNAYLEKKMNELATPEKLKELYLEEIKQIERQDEIHARHILVRTEKEARDILIQLKAGADFKMLANTKSLDAEGGNGGDLGYFQKNMMIPEFGEAVFALKKGQLSQPIKTPFGWHVVVVEDRRLAPPPAFEDVQDQLRQLFVERNIQSVLKQEEARHNVQKLVPTLRQPDPTTELNDAVPAPLTVKEAEQQAADEALAPVEGEDVEEVVEEVEDTTDATTDTEATTADESAEKTADDTKAK